MLTTDLSELIKTIRRDERVKKLRAAFKSHPMYNLKTDILHNEIDILYKQRTIKRLNSTDPRFIDELVEASVIELGTRSRLTGISMACSRAISTLDAAISALQDYLIIEYSTNMKGFRTKEERARIIKISLKDFVAYVEDVKTVRENAALLIADIDKGSWSLRSIIDAIKVQYKPEMGI